MHKKNMINKKVSMMKKIAFSLFILVIFTTTSVIFAQEKKLNVVGSWNSLTMFKKIEKPFWEDVFTKEFSNYKVSLTSLGEIKIGGASVLQQIDNKLFDVVSTVSNYVVSDSPALAGFDLPALAPDIATARKIVNVYRPTMEELLAKDFNVQLLSVVPYPSQVLFCRSKIKGLADLKGRKVRTLGWTIAKFVDSLGGNGITMSFGEVPTALQRGVIDCAITGSLSGYSSGWGEVSDYLYPLPIGGWAYVMTVMGKDVWNNMSSADQKKLLKLANENIEKKAWEVTDFETNEGEQCLTGGSCSFGKANKMKLVPVVPADLKLAKKILNNNVLPAWREKVTASDFKQWQDTIGKVVK